MRTTFRDSFICIRPFCDTDSSALLEAAGESIGQLCSWMTWCNPSYSIDDSAAFVARSQADWQSGDSYSFAIVDLEDSAFLGSVGLNHINRRHGVGNVGIWVRSSRTRRGVASAAIRLISVFAFEELRLQRVEILVAAANKPSVRMAEKARAKAEGVLRNRLVLGGKPQDAVMFSLVPEDQFGL
jgi:ribosomal-protein-serine acetyltransferase